jgi:mRNA interferase MazF
VVAGEEPPRRGDVVWVSLNSQAGHEQAGRRPALVLSPIEYNNRVGLALMCPVTSRVKGYPFEVPLPENLEVSGVILADQVKSLDWKVRKAEHACTVPRSVMNEVFGKLNALLS